MRDDDYFERERNTFLTSNTTDYDDVDVESDEDDRLKTFFFLRVIYYYIFDCQSREFGLVRTDQTQQQNLSAHSV